MRPRPRILLSSAAVTLAIACGGDTTGPGAAVKLAFTVQPVPTTAGSTIIPAVTVAVQDAAGNTITSVATHITLAIAGTADGATLLGTTTLAASNGVASFTNLRINKAGSAYTLSATAPNLTAATSSSFAVAVGPARNLAFTVQPVPTTAGATIAPAVTVAVLDAGGNIVTTASNNITLTFGTNAGGGTLAGTTTMAAVNGIATFSNLSIDRGGLGYTLSAASPSLTTVLSNPFAVLAGPASKLAFTMQPALTAAGVPITPAVAVAVQDAAGNTLTDATNSITVAIGSNAGGGTLAGTTTVAAVHGIATFSDLSIDHGGVGYTLTAAAASLNGATSNAFSVRDRLVFASITAGYFHSCGIASGGAAFCWGDGENGQLGTGAQISTSTPVPVSGGFSFATLSAGRTHSCGVTTGGAGYCWGDNSLGNGSSNLSSSPAAVAGGLSFAAVVAGYAHSCGVTTGGAGYCWGFNGSGELGNGTQGQNPSNAPVAVAGGLSFASISPGRLFSCGRTPAGVAYCWGTNFDGELGDGTTSLRSSPVVVAGLNNFALVSAGGFHSCGLTAAGVAYCWGSNSFGQLGRAGASSSVPVQVAGNLTFASLSAGNRHTCGVTTGGVAYCWGDNSSGNLGTGTTTGSSIPAAVAGGLSFSTVSAGRFHSCGVTTSGAGYCWGANAFGQLGDGTTTLSLVPVPVL